MGWMFYIDPFTPHLFLLGSLKLNLGLLAPLGIAGITFNINILFLNKSENTTKIQIYANL